jgi:aspartate/methionine/tyrosine aminotransferase
MPLDELLSFLGLLGVSALTLILRVCFSHQGIPLVRQRVAEFIQNRDGYSANPDDIFLTTGASAGVQVILQLLISKGTGIMIPIPQYPLYSATIDLYGGQQVHYYLNEQKEWGLDVFYFYIAQ